MILSTIALKRNADVRSARRQTWNANKARGERNMEGKEGAAQAAHEPDGGTRHSVFPSMSTEALETPSEVAVAQVAPARASRLSSIEAYRGFVMLLMMEEVLRFQRVANAGPGNWF